MVLNSTQVKISITTSFQKLYLWAAGLIQEARKLI